MKQIAHTLLVAIAGVLMLTGTVAAQPAATTKPHHLLATKPIAGILITLDSQPGSPMEQVAQQLMAKELEKSRQAGENPLVLVGTAKLAKSDVLFVQIQSARECGSAGCSTTSFRKVGGRWVKILDTVAGTIRVAKSSHRGMPDLIVEDRNRMIWNGAKYV